MTLSPDHITPDLIHEVWPYLTKEERCELRKLIRTAKLPLWTPHPDNVPQQHAYDSLAHITGYGGGAGGGKSDLIEGLAGTRHRKSIVFRWEFPLHRDLIERSRELFTGQGKANFNANEHIWHNIPGKRSLEFGAIHHLKNLENYRGRAHDLKAFDEATEFPEHAARFLMGWNRSTIPGQACRIVLCFNPPTTEDGMWVIRFFAPWYDPDYPNPARPGELRWFVTKTDASGKVQDIEVDGPETVEMDGEERIPRSRTLIPALLGDNPYLADTDYGGTLDNLPEPLRSQLKYGRVVLRTEDDPWQVIPREWLEMAHKRWAERPEPDVLCTAIGGDIARGGKDRAATCKRYGNWFAPIKTVPGSETPDGPTAAAFILREHEDDALVNVDVIGVGGSAYDSLADGSNVRVQAINFAERSTFTDRTGKLNMRNKRAEAMWRLREALDPIHGDDLAIPPDPEFDQEAYAHTYRVTPGGVLINPKRDEKGGRSKIDKSVEEKIGRSPDKFDSLVMTLLPEEVDDEYKMAFA